MFTFLIYWAACTAYGVLWMIKNPSSRHGDDAEYFTLLDLVGHFFICAVLAWVFVPLSILGNIRFKRNIKK